jgi:hypothetical protein
LAELWIRVYHLRIWIAFPKRFWIFYLALEAESAAFAKNNVKWSLIIESLLTILNLAAAVLFLSLHNWSAL